jgi:hypothetical protein
MRTQRWLQLLLLVAPLSARAAAADEFVTFADVALVCAEVKDPAKDCPPVPDKFSLKDHADLMKNFCTLQKAPADPAAWDKDPNWRRSNLPTAQLVKQVALWKGKCVSKGQSGAGTPGIGLNQSTLLWGATDFLVERARAELQTWLYKRFAASLCDKTGDQQLVPSKMFASSCKVLQTGGADLTLYLGGLGVLRDSLRQDLKRLPYLILAEATSTDAYDKQPEIRDAVLAATYLVSIVENVLQGTPADQAFGGLPQGLADQIDGDPILKAEHDSGGPVNDFFEQSSCTDLPAAAAVYRVAALIRGGLSATAPVEPAEFNALAMAVAVNTKSDELWPAKCSAANDPDITIDPSNLITVARLLHKGSLGALRTALDDLKNAKSTEEKLRALGAVANAVFTIGKQALALAPTNAKLEEVGLVLDQGAVIARALALGDYTTVLYGALGLVGAELLAIKDRLPKNAVRLISFAAAAAQAQDVKGVAEAFDRFAAPPGSAMIKRRSSDLYIGLNAYVGVTGGIEFAKQASDSFRDLNGNWMLGATVPIGLEFGGATGDGWSFSFLVQLIDLGTLAQWRLTTKDDALKERPEVGLRQVISPGGYLVLGLPDMPLSVGVGASLAPALRSLKTQDPAADTQRDAIRVNAFLAVDIPLFP